MLETQKTVKLPVRGTEITINAPTVGVFRRAVESVKKPELQGMAVLATCCNMTETELDALDLRDMLALQKEVDGFLAGTGISISA
jgi:hypothetical protein